MRLGRHESMAPIVKINLKLQSYGTNSQNKFKTAILESSVCDYTDSYILLKRKITISGRVDTPTARAAHKRNEGVIFENCAVPTVCISKINNAQIDNAKCLDIVMLMCNLIEYSENHSQTSGNRERYCKDELHDSIIRDSKSLKYKVRITGKAPNGSNTKDVETVVRFKYLSYYWRTHEMPLFMWIIKIHIKLVRNSIITSSVGKVIFAITDTKFHLLKIMQYY